MLRYLFSLAFLFLLQPCWSQTGTVINTDFKFLNGVYSSLSGLQKNKPDHAWETLDAEAHINSTNYEVKFSFARGRNNGPELDFSKFWGVVIDGIPYIRVNPFLKEERLSINEKDPQLFVRLQVVGKLCYFYYEAYTKEKKPITVFDPNTGLPIRTAYIDKDKEVIMKKMLQFDTGEVVPYDLEHFLTIIETEDKGLYKTLTEMEEPVAREKLYKSLFIYNDRNLVYLRK